MTNEVQIFQKWRDYYEGSNKSEFINVLNETKQIADEFAIGFAEWIRKETYYEHLTKEFIYKRNVYKSEKELLKIYKEEKGL